VAAVESQIDRIEQYRKQRAEYESAMKARQNESPGVVTLAGEQPASASGTQEVVTMTAQPPKHPTVPDGGRKHIATGTIRGVVCGYPSVIEFRLELAAGKSLALYNNDFFKIALSAVKAIPGTVNPCADFEGRKVEVEYVDSPDKTVNGQVIAIMLKN